jgi:hypothetical protein
MLVQRVQQVGAFGVGHSATTPGHAPREIGITSLAPEFVALSATRTSVGTGAN